MKLVTFSTGGTHRLGVSTEDGKIIDLQQAYKELLDHEGIKRASEIAAVLIPSDTVDFLAGGERSLSAAKEALDFVSGDVDSSSVLNREEVTLGAPVQNPGKIICVGHNYREHILEMKRDIPTHPVLFSKASNAVSGPEDDVPLPGITQKLDYEGEFAFVIGKRAKNVAKEDALDYVAGYTIVNDVTARDIQKRTLQWFQGKNLDGSAPMGPWLITKDEISDPHSLDIMTIVNGEVRQHSNTSSLVFNVNTLVSFISEIMTLEPGDIICTGTPGGVGDAMKPQVYLKDGDVVEVKIDQIGRLTNKIKEVSKEMVW